MIVDLKKHKILLNDRRSIYLPTIQSDIFEILYNNKGNLVTYEEIAKKVYKDNCDKYIKDAIRQNIAILRNKIGKYVTIGTVWTKGYIIEEEIE